MVVTNIIILHNNRQFHHCFTDDTTMNTSMRSSVGVSIKNTYELICHRISAVNRMPFYMMIANVITFMITEILFHFYGVIQIYIQVVSSFNQTYFNIIVTRIEIRSILKIDNTKYDMITDISFYCTRIDCNATYINQSVLSSIPTQNFTLFNVNDSLVDVTAQSSPTFVDNTGNVATTPLSVINYSKGESPPGVAAQLGMGVGITIIGILLIGEIIYFYRKYGLNGSMHHSNYALPPFHRQLSI
ncbi:unnamed protein product [Rotaria sordida]|uniref:Uncharacterized protein n=1 Tax=Rotaria sordida TaxID=392033 RepID=A0A815KQW6_9BILA|nr:unnamed protein product [Rotaria sordida]